jgi:zinc protease
VARGASAILLCLVLGPSVHAQSAPPGRGRVGGDSSRASAPIQYPTIAVEYYRLANGLRVVLSRDSTTPVVVIGVYYGIGQRTESPGHEGFAHLFEHLMFEGSTHLGPRELLKLIQSNGGTLNGSTRFDFTNYYEIVPPPALRLMLWAESDRMGGLVVDDSALRRQKSVVESEVRVAYVNRADGGFPWLDVPQVANRNWQNAHNFRGLPAQLDSATLDDVRRFHDAYYVVNNAVLVVSGDFRPADARTWIDQYFRPIPRGHDVVLPDITEPQQTEERRGERVDSLATTPVLAVAYHMPARETTAFYAMAIIDQLLLQAGNNWMTEELVHRRSLATAVYGGANLQGHMFNYKGPMLWAVAVNYDRLSRADSIVAAVQQVIDRMASDPVKASTLDVAKRQLRSGLYDIMDYLGGFGRADLLASFALFDDDPAKINQLEGAIDGVTAADITETVRTYLSVPERTVYVRRPPDTPRRPAGQ